MGHLLAQISFQTVRQPNVRRSRPAADAADELSPQGVTWARYAGMLGRSDDRILPLAAISITLSILPE